MRWGGIGKRMLLPLVRLPRPVECMEEKLFTRTSGGHGNYSRKRHKIAKAIKGADHVPIISARKPAAIGSAKVIRYPSDCAMVGSEPSVYSVAGELDCHYAYALNFCHSHGLPVVHKATRVDRRDVAQIMTAITGAALAAHKIAIEWKRELDSKPTEDDNEK